MKCFLADWHAAYLWGTPIGAGINQRHHSIHLPFTAMGKESVSAYAYIK